MLDWIARHLQISPAVAAILLVIVVAQLVLQIYAVVDLVRRDAVLGGRKWVWALVIAFGNLVGAIVYLVVARVEPPLSDAASRASTAGDDAAQRAVDALYGPRNPR